MADLKIPNYYGTIPEPHKHPALEELRQDVEASHPKGEYHYRHAAYELLWSYLVPNAVVKDKIMVAIAFSLWLASVASIIDGCDKTTLQLCEDLREWLDDMCRVVKGQAPSKDFKGHAWEKPFDRFRAIRAKIMASSDFGFQRRFEQATIDMLQAFSVDIVSPAPQFPTQGSWIHHKVNKSPVRPMCRLLEWLLEVKLPDWIMECSKMIEIEEFCAEVVAFQGDVIMYKARTTQKWDAPSSTIRFLMNSEGANAQKALEETDALASKRIVPIKQLQGEIVDLINQDKEGALEVTKYLVAMQKVPPAFLWWRKERPTIE